MIAGFGLSARRDHYLPERQGSGGLLPWVIAVMVFLTALAIAAGAGLAHATGGLSRALERTMTVQIIEANPDRRDAEARAAAQLLRGEPGIAAVRPVGHDDIVRLLEPWLGGADFGRDLPLPAMIDVELAEGAAIDGLEDRLRAVAPSARVDGHGRWLGPLTGLVRALQWLAAVVVLLSGGAMAAVVALGTRSGLNVHRPTIEVLHLMGAEDRTIAGIFQRRYGIHGLTGGAIGLAAALVVLYFVGRMIERMGGGLIGDIGLPWAGWLALALLPGAAMLLTMLTARRTVLRALAAQL